MFSPDELIDHIRQLENELERAKSELRDYEEGYISEEDIYDVATERYDLIDKDYAWDYVMDSGEVIDKDDHNSVVRALEELADVSEALLECEPDCEECRDSLRSAISDARCYV